MRRSYPSYSNGLASGAASDGYVSDGSSSISTDLGIGIFTVSYGDLHDAMPNDYVREIANENLPTIIVSSVIFIVFDNDY